MKKWIALLFALTLAMPNAIAEELPANQALDGTQLTNEADEAQMNPEISASPAQHAAFISRFECDGFASPEEAVQSFIEAFNQGDVPGMLSTFAIETYVDHMDQQAYLEALKSFSPWSYDSYPVFSDLSRNLLAAARWGELAQRLCQQYIMYAMPGESGGYNMTPVSFAGEDSTARIQEFLDGFEQASYNSWVGNIAFIGFMDLSQVGASQYETYTSESNQKNLEKYMACYGCNELVDLLAQIQIQGEDYVQFMQCARYGDLWYNLRFGGTFADLLGLNNFWAGLVPLSPFTE